MSAYISSVHLQVRCNAQDLARAVQRTVRFYRASTMMPRDIADVDISCGKTVKNVENIYNTLWGSWDVYHQEVGEQG